MSDTDRRLDDIEKRLRALETLEGKRWRKAYAALKSEFAPYCACGRDICRAPDCPSHKADPLGR